MMKQYKDRIGRCVCYADAVTGVVEHEYKKVKTKTTVPIGGEFIVERDGIITILKRINTVKFKIISYKKAA